MVLLTPNDFFSNSLLIAFQVQQSSVAAAVAAAMSCAGSS
jgi:hypothetical protein